MITLEDYLNHWRVNYGHVQVDESALTEVLKANASVTVSRANRLLAEFGEERPITSGWRPVEVNRVVPGAALRSKHTECRAVDISDPDGDLDEWCLDHFAVLGSCGLWLEHPSATKGWCHVQIIAPKSGKRVFYP